MNYLGLPGQEKILKRRGNQFDTIKLMKKVAYESAKNPFFRAFINKHQLYNDPEALNKIFHYCFEKVKYLKDPKNKQYIRSGIRSLKEGRGNCVDYCILLSSFLLNLNIPHKFRMISTTANSPNNYGHIYIKAGSIPMDLVIGQDQQGKEIFKRDNERTPFFNKEIPYVKKYDLVVY